MQRGTKQNACTVSACHPVPGQEPQTLRVRDAVGKTAVLAAAVQRIGMCVGA